MSELKLSKRLQAIADLIPKDRAVVDVGTDHGYIPVWLRQNGFSGKITASDINKDPLNHARETAISNGFEDSIDFILCNGLEGVDPDSAFTIVIAGMGGENIADILMNAPWTCQNGRKLILQPMTKSDELREFLSNNKYKIIEEKLVFDGKIYEILVVESGIDVHLSPAELYIGRFELIKSDPLFSTRLEDLVRKLERAVTGMEASNRIDDALRLKNTKEALRGLYEMRDGGSNG